MCDFVDDGTHNTVSLSDYPVKNNRMRACRRWCYDQLTVQNGDFCCSYMDREEEGYPDTSNPWDSCWFVEGGEQIGAGMGH